MGELGVGGSNAGAVQRPDSGLGWNSSAPPDPASLREECLSVAEEAAQQVLTCIHPTLNSQEERRDIIEYIQRLINSHLNCEVFPYGSVPLRTYLPDGDIDLTAINGTTANESLALDVLALLQREAKNENAEFEVKDTQYIDAEVKLVKCLVRNTIIDITFNQLGGLSTLCFVEQVDRLVGRNHIFKRSIILIKAWCYYESRILGAHHGLISTYALEILVLYIFQLYHSSLCGPLVVLYRFLEYYSEFDWENYCISLKGPVCKSSLPDIVVEVPENGWTDLMFSEEFLDNCMEMFSVSSRALEGKPKAFKPKHLNIVDPLKENNNLGRSVHKGSFYRIRSAFKYGARKLGQVLSLPFDKVADEIHKFFSNTVSRHGNDNRKSIQHLPLEFGDKLSLTASLSSPVQLISEDSLLLKSSVNDNGGVELELTLKTGSEGWYPTGVNSVHHNALETYDAIASSSSLRNGSPYDASRRNYSTPLSWNNCHEQLSAENGRLETGNFLKNDLVDSASQKYDFKSWLEDSKKRWEANNRYQWCADRSQAIYIANLDSSVTKANNVDDVPLDSKDVDSTSTADSEVCDPLADLSGDYDSHIRSLVYGQFSHGFALAALLHHHPSTKNEKPWDIVDRSMPFWWREISKLTLRPVSTDNCRASEVEKARGSGPHANGSRPQGRSRKKASRCGHEHSNGLHTVKNKENESHEHQRGLNAKCPSPPGAVGNENRTDGELSEPWRIEFGSVGNLAEELISGSADIEGSTLGESVETTAAMEQERFAAGQLNEADFPPLNLIRC